MGIITFTSDLGNKDFYVSAVKGKILSLNPDAQIIDISHEIEKFNIIEAAFNVKNIIKDFPEKTVHIISVLPEATETSPHLICEYKKQYFIASDNGIFSLIFESNPDKIIEPVITYDSDSTTFPTKDIFAKIAAHLSKGGKPEDLGGIRDSYLERTTFLPVYSENFIQGTVIYIDSYGNLFTNITQRLFEDVRNKRRFTILIRGKEYRISSISKSYNDVPSGEIVALFSDTGYLEIANNLGNASNLLGLQKNDTIRIEFEQ
ncbi:MAG: hypothetical protein D6707_07580 [Bacteroidetes bacterium]|nr:MAG: hypothetical protein D6707_07580 [Bacteroidota bacterium]